MHPNAALLHKLFTALDEHKYETMASCYASNARFRDIAFDRDGVGEIRSMWRMICREETNIEVKSLDVQEADDRTGRARVVETYRYGASKRDNEDGVSVTNEIESRFEFEKGLIKSQIDDCDPKKWAEQAMEGHPIMAFLAGRIRLVRSFGAWKKLRKFRKENPE